MIVTPLQVPDYLRQQDREEITENNAALDMAFDDLLDAKGIKVGYVSYNGKVWTGDWDAGTAVCIFNPYA